MSGFTEIWLEGSVAYYKPDLCLNVSLQMSVYTTLDITPTAATEHVLRVSKLNEIKFIQQN